MYTTFSNRIHSVPRSFIREILKITHNKDVISFAGGLPNPDLFPITDLQIATEKVFSIYGAEALQYSNSEGSLELREIIASHYAQKGITVNTSEILITSGSQQALDLLGKIFINEGDEIIIEEPGYLGAIQAFSMYKPVFLPVPLVEYGLDSNYLSEITKKHAPKLMYIVPNFQNPSGISYSETNRTDVSKILGKSNVLVIEDDPYGELRFKGARKKSFKTLLPNQTIMLGTFSKIVVPSFRLGWIVAPTHIIEKLIIAKQAADLHTNYFCQLVLCEYFKQFDNRKHIDKVCYAYGNQCFHMIQSIQKYFPEEVSYTNPEGGMFLWATLPEGLKSSELLEKCMQLNVVFVPGDQFYTNRSLPVNTFRLNFSCANEEMIDKGIRIIGNAIKSMIKE